MKKLLTLVLALVMVLAIAAPAMAFTKEGEQALEDYDITLELQEWDDQTDFFRGDGVVVTDDPAADRGYVKNEIVCVKAGITVPKYATPEGNLALYLTGENVDFGFNIKNYAFLPLANQKAYDEGFEFVAADYNAKDEQWEWDDQDLFEGLKKDATYQWLFWARVLDDDASITWTLELDGKAGKDLYFDVDNKVGDDTIYVHVVGDKTVFVNEDGAQTGDADFSFAKPIVNAKNFDKGAYILDIDGYKDYRLVITFKGNFKTTGMFILDTDTAAPVVYEVKENSKLYVVDGLEADATNEEIIALDLSTLTIERSATTDKAASRFLDAVMEAYNLDPANAGNILRPTYFSTGSSAKDSKEVTVEIKPWEAYLSVPDVVVVDPPKTGDASTMIGFVMIIAALAGVVVCKKVRA